MGAWDILGGAWRSPRGSLVFLSASFWCLDGERRGGPWGGPAKFLGGAWVPLGGPGTSLGAACDAWDILISLEVSDNLLDAPRVVGLLPFHWSSHGNVGTFLECLGVSRGFFRVPTDGFLTMAQGVQGTNPGRR